MYRSNCHIDYNPLFLIISKETSTAPRRRPSGRLNLNGLEQWKKEKVKVKSLSHVKLFGTPWMVAYQGLQSMGFSRQEYWSGLPFPSPGDLPNPGIEPWSPAL